MPSLAPRRRWRLLPPLLPPCTLIKMYSCWLAGHAYYFLEDVYPRMTGRRPLKTPGFVKAMFPGEDVISPAAFVMPAQAAVRPPGAAPPAAPAAVPAAPAAAADVGGGAGARGRLWSQPGCMQVWVLVLVVPIRHVTGGKWQTLTAGQHDCT